MGGSGSTANIIKYYYAGGQRIAVQDSAGLKYIHTDHLNSTSRMSNAAGASIRELHYDPWGSVAADEGGSRMRYTYTGQGQEVTGLYDYQARLYDPRLGRFTQPDSIVPGAADGAGGGAATLGYDPRTRLTPLTVNLGEFAAQISEENREITQYGWFFQWDESVRQQHNVPMGPANPQALNRYAYCLNNPKCVT